MNISYQLQNTKASECFQKAMLFGLANKTTHKTFETCQ